MTAIYTHKFKDKWEYEGRTYTEMTFDFSHLTGEDLIQVEAEIESEGISFMIPEWSSRCKIKLASRASQIGDDVLRALPIRDFKAITGKVNAFLNFGDLGDDEE